MVCGVTCEGRREMVCGVTCEGRREVGGRRVGYEGRAGEWGVRAGQESGV